MPDDQRLTPQSEDFSAWYNELVQQAELAGHSPVRGCMVIRPYGYRIWELMQGALDAMFKETGHQNAYFPLFLPQSALDREAEHVEGFAPQTAVVTHAGGSELDEPLVVRPTSEAIIWPIAADWIQSYRDLPLLLNQWANVVRWEMRTRPFLRTSEFLWQEGHTAHATAEDALEETHRMLGVYRRFMEEWMALPVITGEKTPAERFAGAERTFACEALMKDNRALQTGTSHFLGQNFARAFDVRFQTEAGEHDFVWNTSWGVSTRLVGGLVMAHGDDDGLVLPPRLAPYQVVIVPIWKSEGDRERVLEGASRLRGLVAASTTGTRTGATRVHVDTRETLNPGAKYYEWERRGVPVRIEIGPRDVSKGQAVVVRRLTPEGAQRKRFLPEAEVPAAITAALEDTQVEVFEAARARREAMSRRGVDDYDAFRGWMESGEVGFVFAGWCGSDECEARVKDETKATIRVLPDPEFRSDPPPGRCLVCGGDVVSEAVWARAY